MAQKKQADEPDSLRDRFETDLNTARKFMQPIHQAMDRNYEMYRNRWGYADTDNKLKVSDLYAYTETVVPILTNSRVRASVHSDYPDYIKHAQGLADILDHTYDVNNWDYEAQEIARMAEIYRSSVAYTGYDAEYKNGTGKLCVRGINIRWCYFDPSATKFEESGFFIFVEPMRKSKVVKMYPDKKKDILDSMGKSNGSMSTEGGKGNNWFRTWVNTFKNFLTFNADNTQANQLKQFELQPEMSEEDKHKNSVAFIHFWYRDDDDKWRVSYWADDVFLEDKENPFWHEKLPYDLYNPTKDILSVLGVPMAEQIENLNWEKVVMMNYIRDNARLHADPPRVHNTAYGNMKDPGKANETFSRNGSIAINNPDFVPLNAIVDVLQVPTMPAYVIDMPDRLMAIEDRLTGVNDSFRGMSDATSGKEVQLKQEAAYTRIKTKIDNFELFNKNIAEKIIVNAMQFYDKTRGFRIKGDYSKYQAIIDQQNQDPSKTPFMVKPIQKGVDPGTGQPNFDRSEFFMYANPNEWTDIVDKGENETETQPTMAEDTQEADAKATKESAQRAYRVLQMTVEIEAGSSLPTSRLARREEAMELFSAGAIDQEALLDSFDWPKREDVMKRMQEAAQAQQEAQMQQQQQQAQMQAQDQQAQMQQQLATKQMETEAKMQQQAMQQEHQTNVAHINNQAKKEQAQAKQQPQQPDIASGLDAIRKAVPEIANMSDEQLLQLVSNMPKAG